MSIKEKENANHFHQTTPLNDFLSLFKVFCTHL